MVVLGQALCEIGNLMRQGLLKPEDIEVGHRLDDLVLSLVPRQRIRRIVVPNVERDRSQFIGVLTPNRTPNRSRHQEKGKPTQTRPHHGKQG